MSDAGTTSWQVRDRWTLLLVASAVVGAFLRFWHLGTWSFWGDEGFTLLFSGPEFSWGDQRPLAFAMNRYIAIPLFGETEFALRLFPAMAGAAAVPVLGWLTGRCYGRAAGALTALLTALSTLLIYYSQYARYYAQAYLCATVFVFALRLWAGGAGSRWLVLAVASFVIGWAFVPTIVLSAAGIGLWLLWNAPRLLTPALRTWVRRNGLLLAACALVLLLAGGVLTVRLVRYMVELTAMAAPYYTLPRIAVTTVVTLGLPVVVLMAAGLWLCWRDESLDQLDRTFLPLVTLGSVAAFVAIFFLMPLVSPWHLVSALGPPFAAAGLALAALWRRGGAVAPAAATGALLAASAPELVSYHIDGARYDYRGGIEAVRALRTTAAEPVVVYGAALVRYLAPDLAPIEFQPGPEPFPWLADSARRHTTWVMLPEGRRGHGYPTELASIAQMHRLCTPVRRVGRQRYGFYDFTVVIYRCPAAGAPGSAAP